MRVTHKGEDSKHFVLQVAYVEVAGQPHQLQTVAHSISVILLYHQQIHEVYCAWKHCTWVQVIPKAD
jgi:hypothetical protein